MASRTIFELSELDQIMPRLHVRWLLCIPLAKTSPSKAAIINILEKGVTSLMGQMPILAGNLAQKSSDPSWLEVHILVLEEPRSSTLKFALRINHLDGEDDETIPTYEALKKANFPVSELPDKILTPLDSTPLAVFDLKINFIRGGVLLCVKCHHSVVDGGGLGLIIRLLAQCCYAAPQDQPTARISERLVPSIDRNTLPSPKKELPQAQDLGFSIVEDKTIAAPAKEYGPMTSHIFTFSAQALQQVKILCGSDRSSVSSHDALTALLYGAVSYARALRLSRNSSKDTMLPSAMGIAVNGRGRLRPPIPEYAGNVTLYATFSHPLHIPEVQISSEAMKDPTLLANALELPLLASKTHSAIAAVTEDYITSTISLAASLKDVSRLQPSFSDFYQGNDFFITSGADFPVFEDEWWSGGKVDALRIPLKAQWDGSCAVLATKDRSQGLEILLGLREDDMSVVKEISFAFGAYIK